MAAALCPILCPPLKNAGVNLARVGSNGERDRDGSLADAVNGFFELLTAFSLRLAGKCLRGGLVDKASLLPL
jgi:hypothetical protein